VALREASYVLGAPERFALGPLAGRAHELQLAGRRVLALAVTQTPLPADPGDGPPPDSRLLGLVVIAERLRPNVSQTIAFLHEQGVEVKVLSGDSPQTVAAIARDVGIPVHTVSDGGAIPEDPSELRAFALEASVVGRISPEGKRAVVGALNDAGHYVAMLGDRRQRRASAQGRTIGDRAGQRCADGAQRLRPRADLR
jgi:cation-transporting ATPase E